MPAFTNYIMVDWSSASQPKTGADSIWVASARRHGGEMKRTRLQNLSTRQEATDALGALLEAVPKRGRALIGFDFPFGYVRGTAAALGMDKPAWRHMWRRITADIRDDDENRNNRFDIAEGWNRYISGEPFPFWGNVREEDRPHLSRKRFRGHEEGDLPERRLVEAMTPTAQPVWKLAYAGSVGSQVLLGIPRVWMLRNDPRFATEAALWPFETGLKDDPAFRFVFAEIYPSLIEPKKLRGKPKDAGQVAAMVEHLAALDEDDALVPFFEADPRLSPVEAEEVEGEEGWILGVTGPRRFWTHSERGTVETANESAGGTDDET